MVPLNEIKHIRKNLGLTQKQLADEAGLSQSFIAKLEAGDIDPTYSHVEKLTSVLDRMARHEEKKAKDIMGKSIFFLKPENKANEAIELMKKRAISQIPVLSKNKAVGIVSETTILNNFGKDMNKILLKDIMEDAPPVLSKEATITIVSELLKHYPLILVQDSGKLKGVITKSDLFKNMKKIS